MATVNLSRGSTNVRQYYTGTHNGQYINFYCSYSNNGQLSVRLNVSLTSTYNWSTSNASAWVNFGVNSKEGAASFTGSSAINKNQNQDFCTKKATYTAPTTITVYSYIQVYSGGWGPTASGGRYISFTISVPGIYTDCTAPTSFSINTTFAKPNSKATLNWSGAKGGTNNGIKRYYIEQSINNGSWGATNPYNLNSTSGSGSLNITLPNEPGATVKFRIRTEGAAGSSYYSGYKESSNSCSLWSNPVLPSWGTLAGQNISGSCYAYHNYGTTTIYWKEATVTANTFTIIGYELWYSESSISNGPWTDRQKIGYLDTSAYQKTNQVKKPDGSIETISSQVFSYDWTGGTVGKYYKFCVVAMTQNFEYWSTTNQWGNYIVREVSTTKLTAPKNLTSNLTEVEITQPIIINWGAAGNGVNNTVSGYELYYSINNSNFSIINTNIPADSLTYNWSVPSTFGSLRLRLRAKGSAGTSFYSDYIELNENIVIKQPEPPKTGNISVIYNTEEAENNPDSFEISWSNFIPTSYYIEGSEKIYVNPIKSYSLYVETRQQDGEYRNLTLISDNISSEKTSYIWTGNNEILIWGNLYRFYIRANGLYYGQSEFAISSEVEREALAAKPPSAFQFLGSGYFINGEQKYAIPGLKIAVMPIGASKAISYKVQYYIWKNGQDWNNIPDSSWVTLSEILNLNEYTSFILIPTEVEEGDCLIFRALARNASGDETEYFPKTINEANQQKLILYSFDKENRIHPVVQIKRAYKDVWDREDNNENGIRLAEGELALEYLNNNTPLKMRVGDGKTKFKELPYLNFGSGIKTANFIIGTSLAGWTINDCDYLCDGTDDEVEINQAISALSAVEGGEIILLEGIYHISDSIVIDKSSLTLKGNGPSTCITRSPSLSKTMSILIVSSVDNIVLKDFDVSGINNSSEGITNLGIQIIECNNVIIDKVNMSGFKHATDDTAGRAFQAADTNNLTVSTCNISDSGDCLSLATVTGFTISNNNISSNNKSSSMIKFFNSSFGTISNNYFNSSGTNIEISNSLSTIVNHIIIESNNFSTNSSNQPSGTGPFVSISSEVSNINIIGNTFTDGWVSFTGITCNGSNCNINNNLFHNLSRGCDFYGSYNSLSNNTIKNIGSVTYVGADANNNTISNNNINQAYSPSSSISIYNGGSNNFAFNNLLNNSYIVGNNTIQYPYLNNIPWYTGNTMSTYAFAKACPSHCNFVTTINKEHYFSDSPLGASMYGIMHVYCGSANYRDFIIYRVGGANIYFGSMNGNGTAVTWRQITLTNI